jgi:hypothetical protein
VYGFCLVQQLDASAARADVAWLLAGHLQAGEAARLSVVGVYDWLEANNKLSEHQVRRPSSTSSPAAGMEGQQC